MRSRSKIILTIGSILFLATTVATLFISRTSSSSKNDSLSESRMQPNSHETAPVRNLSLQPEAYKLSRRLGNRFSPSQPKSLTIFGTLTTESVEQKVNIIRSQTPAGETIEVGIVGEAGRLLWSSAEGLHETGPKLTDAKERVIERLILDNPDQFVLAQLRGASYYTVAHNVRADDAGNDSYNGPLWEVIRVEEPKTVGLRQPGKTRLFYINMQTGLLDKIVTENKDEQDEAQILEWVDQAGEKLPSHIIWKRGNETIQEFRFTSLEIQSLQ